MNFPSNPQVNDEHGRYRYIGNGVWEIIGVDLTADYPEIHNGTISASVIPQTIARTEWVQQEISNIDLSPYLTNSSASSTYATINYVDNEINNIDALPSQNGNQGKFLTTSGSSAYWETVDALPSQSGNSGKFLTTDGNDASWATVDLSSASAAAVAAIVDTAPETLNTLNELAAALNDDANFAGTVTNSLSQKLDISSASVTYATLVSPSLTTPNIGVASGTSLSLSGNIVGHVDISTPTFTSNTYTITSSDDGKLLMLDNSSSSGSVYVPTDSTYNFLTGTQITLVQKGSGQITVSASNPGTTVINYTPGNKFRTQWSSATLIKISANEWMLMGDLEI